MWGGPRAGMAALLLALPGLAGRGAQAALGCVLGVGVLQVRRRRGAPPLGRLRRGRHPLSPRPAAERSHP